MMENKPGNDFQISSIKASGEIKIDYPLFLFKHFLVFFFVAILVVAGTFFGLMLILAGKGGNHNKKATEIYGNYAMKLVEFNQETWMRFIYLIVTALITSYIVARNLSKKRVSVISRNDKKLFFKQKNYLGRNYLSEYPIEELSVKLEKSQGILKKLTFSNKSSQIAKIEIDHIIWNKGKAFQLDKFVTAIDGLKIEMINLDKPEAI